jgi:hypothetical protein
MKPLNRSAAVVMSMVMSVVMFTIVMFTIVMFTIVTLTTAAMAQVTTSQYDNPRTGGTLHVWAIATKTWNGPDNKPAVLYAFDANRLGLPIYTSAQNSQRDRAALATRFVIPVVVNGRVYFGARGEVEVYGLIK